MKINEIILHEWPWNEVKWSEMKWNLVKLDRENQQQDLLNSIKSQSLYSYQDFRPKDLFPHLKDLLIVLIVLKSLDTSMNPEHDKHANLFGFQTHV